MSGPAATMRNAQSGRNTLIRKPTPEDSFECKGVRIRNATTIGLLCREMNARCASVLIQTVQPGVWEGRV